MAVEAAPLRRRFNLSDLFSTGRAMALSGMPLAGRQKYGPLQLGPGEIHADGHRRIKPIVRSSIWLALEANDRHVPDVRLEQLRAGDVLCPAELRSPLPALPDSRWHLSDVAIENSCTLTTPMDGLLITHPLPTAPARLALVASDAAADTATGTSERAERALRRMAARLEQAIEGERDDEGVAGR